MLIKKDAQIERSINVTLKRKDPIPMLLPATTM